MTTLLSDARSSVDEDGDEDSDEDGEDGGDQEWDKSYQKGTVRLRICQCLLRGMKDLDGDGKLWTWRFNVYI